MFVLNIAMVIKKHIDGIRENTLTQAYIGADDEMGS